MNEKKKYDPCLGCSKFGGCKEECEFKKHYESLKNSHDKLVEVLSDVQSYPNDEYVMARVTEALAKHGKEKS